MHTPAEQEEIAAGYRAETLALIRKALPLAVIVYVASTSLPAMHEAFFHPERRGLILIHILADWCVGAFTIAITRYAEGRTAVVWTGVLFVALTSMVSGMYNAAVAGRAERFVLRELCLLSGAALFLPWGLAPQITAMCAVAAALALTGPMMSSSDATSYLNLVLVMGGTISAGVAAYLDRDRRFAYERSARDREAAAVSAKLLAAVRALTPIEDPDRIFAELTTLAIAGVGCDWCAVFTWDATAKRYTLAHAAGAGDDERACFDATPPPPTITASQVGDAMHATFTAAWHVTALLVAALPGTDAQAPLLACGWRHEPHPLPRRCHRLTQGFAEAGGMALDGARVVIGLRRTTELKSEFASTISHEMRTPLNVILGSLEMGRDKDLSEADRDDCLARAEVAGRQLLMLIEDALDVGRLETGGDDPEFETVQLTDLWANIQSQCSTLPQPDGVRLEWTAVEPGMMVTDVHKLAVVVRNLVQNALKFTSEGYVRVEALRAGDDLVINVTDTGIGILPEQQSTIFELFRQGDGSETRKYGGAGLGLYIARRFVDQLGGAITVDTSRAQGTAFSVRTPTRIPAEATLRHAS